MDLSNPGRRFCRAIPAVAAASLFLLPMSVQCPAGELRVALTPAVDRIKVLDPLHVKVSVENGDKRAVAITPTFDTPAGTIEFYLRRKGEQEFAPFHTPLQGARPPLPPFPLSLSIYRRPL
jgi:hypothetical protein